MKPVRPLLTLVVAWISLGALRLSPGGYPPDLRAPFYGTVRLRLLRGATAATQHLYLAVDRGGDGSVDATYYLGELTGTQTTLNTHVDVEPGDHLDLWLFTTHMQPHDLPVRYQQDRTLRPGEPEPRVLNHWTTGGGAARWCGEPEGGTPLDVSALYAGTEHLLALSCWEDWYDFDHNDFAVAVDYVPGTAIVPDPQVAADHPWLVWYGPRVGQPTEVLRGTGFTPEGEALIHVMGPAGCGGASWSLEAGATGTWVLDAGLTGDAWFGTFCRGVWQAWAEDVASGLASNAVTWTVAWFPIHRVR